MDSIKSVQHKDFTRVGEEVIKISGAVASTESWKNGHLDGIWQILGRLIVESLYFNTHRSKTDGIVERAVRRIQEGTSAVLLQSGLDERWWSDSMECYCYLRNVQDLLADGKTPYERRFEEPFKGPIIPFGAMVEDHPSSPNDQARIHLFGKKELQGIILGYELTAVTNWKGDIPIADVEDLEKLDTSASKNRIDQTKRWWLHIPHRRWYSKMVRERPRIPSTHCKAGTTCKEWRYQWRNSGRMGRVWTGRTNRWRWSPCRFFGRLEVTSSIVITMNLEFNSTCRRKTRSLFHSNTLMFRGPHIQMSMCCKKRRLAIVGMSIRMSICQMILGEGSQNSLYWKRSLQKDTCGPGGDWRRFKRHPDQIMFGQKYGRKLVKPLRIEKNRNGQKKSQNLTMLDNWEEFTLLIQTTKNTKKFSKMRGTRHVMQKDASSEYHESDAKQWQREGVQNKVWLCSGISWIHETASRIFAVQNSWRSHCRKEFTSVTHYNLVHKFITRPQAMKIPGAKAAVDKEWEKLGRRQHMKSNLRSWGKQYKQNITCKFILSFDHARVSWIYCEWWETTPTRAGTCAEFRSCGRWQTISALDVLYEMDGTKNSLHRRSVGLVFRRRRRRSQEKRIEWDRWEHDGSQRARRKLWKSWKVRKVG